MNLLIPKFDRGLLPKMLGFACLGALIAGVYGIAHDQITYSISEEYYTKLKFDQFEQADFGFGPRVFVAEVGFLATWWVGLIVAWFLARIAIPVWPFRLASRKILIGIGLVFVCALGGAGVGGALGYFHSGDYSGWQEACEILGVEDVRAFVSVAYIHNAGYLGALIGVIAAMVWMHRLAKREKAGESVSS